MQATIGEIAKRTGGEVVGDPDLTVFSTATIDRAGAGAITFAGNQNAWERFCKSAAAAAIVSGIRPEPSDRNYIVVPDAEAAFATVVAIFRPGKKTAPASGISPQAIISSTAVIGQGVTIQAGATIGDRVEIGSGSRIMTGARVLDGCRIGSDTVLFPNVVLYENTQVGDRVLIHAGAVIGAYGFGYRNRSGRHVLGPQMGSVTIESDVDIGANTTIDRGTFDDTIIGEGTKIDDQVMIGHNCRIGRHNLLCSQVGIAGSTTTGDYVVMAGQVGIGDHLQIGNHVTLCAKAGVMKSIADGETHLGAPSMPARDQLQLFALNAKLPEFRKKLRELEFAMERLQTVRQDSGAAAAVSEIIRSERIPGIRTRAA